MNNVEAEGDSSTFVSAPQIVPTQYDSPCPTIGVVAAQVVNLSPSVTAAPEADRLSPLTTQAGALTLEDTAITSTTTSTIITTPDVTFASSEVASQPSQVVDELQIINASPNQAMGKLPNVGSPSPATAACKVSALSTPVQPAPPVVNDNTPPVAVVSQPNVNKSVASLAMASQVILPQVTTKPKHEPNPIVSLNMDHPGISDITFMSDEIQPNVDPQEAVDFSSLQKPVVITPTPVNQNVPSPNLASRVLPTPATTENALDTDVKSTTPPSSLNVGTTVVALDHEVSSSAHPVVSAPVIVEPPKKEMVLSEVAPSPQPGGAWAQKKSWSQLFKPLDEGSVAKQVAYVAPFNQDAEKPLENSSREVPIMKTITPIAEADVDKAKIGGKTDFSGNLV